MLTENKDLIELLAEKLLEKETISLPDIVDTLGPRPFPVKDSVMEYLQELRKRASTADETRTEEEKVAEDKRKAAVEGTKFDPDAEEPPAEDDETDAAAKADSEEDAKEEAKDDVKDEAKDESKDGDKKDDKDKKE